MSELHDAEFIVIGGGAIGCGVAYSLARAGITNLLIVERAADVAQVTSAQGAGLCGQPRNSVERTRLAMHSVKTFRELQRDPKVQPDWHEVGSIRIALTAKRAEEFGQLKAIADSVGLDTELIDQTTAQKLWPGLNASQATSILWCPSDGYMTPYAVASAYAYQCRKLGFDVVTSTTVEEILCRDGRVTGIRTNRGRLAVVASLTLPEPTLITSPCWWGWNFRSCPFAMSTLSP